MRNPKPSRKELRKNKREVAKNNKKQHFEQKRLIKATAPVSGPLSKILNEKRKLDHEKDSNNNQGRLKKKKVEKIVKIDPYAEEEDKEIARLEKLLKIDKDRSKDKAIAKLNREYEQFEGMGDDFGKFLMDLDDLADLTNKDRVLQDDDENDDDDFSYDGPLLDDDEQELSDLEQEIDAEEDSEGESANKIKNSHNHDDVDDDDDDDDDESNGKNNEESNIHKSDDEIEDDDEDDDNYSVENENDDPSDDDDDPSDDDDDHSDEERLNLNSFTYQPVEGEDIYGRSKDKTENSGKTQKYVPPARRMTTIDENSADIKLLKRRINGLLNRLSDQSKDSILKELKEIFSSNSITVTTTILKDCILSVCANPSQLMISLIPTYAGLIAALHLTVGIEIGAIIIEQLVLSLCESIKKNYFNDKSGSNSFIISKLPSNTMLLLVYLYNLKVLHHTLIVDVMKALSIPFNKSNTINLEVEQLSEENLEAENSLQLLVNVEENRNLSELRVELLETIINHCGLNIRVDDPISLKDVINALTLQYQDIRDKNDDDCNTRVRFMLQALTDLKNNKSRRDQLNVPMENVKRLRKWLGGVKAMTTGHKKTSVDSSCLRITLKELLQAETRGRWWRTGASWVGNKNEEKEIVNEDNKRDKNRKGEKTEKDVLLELAKKMRMNTPARKSIFVVMMSSRDVSDAFERLERLELKGKEDRQLPRVLVECCAKEPNYNAFYAELGKLLCQQNRQHKTTFQYTFWDFFKLIIDEEEKQSERKVVNLARLSACLISSFHLSLTVLKPIDMSTLNSKMLIFLSTLFFALFSDKEISDEDFQNVMDRVATTEDFGEIRDNILFFLQRYLNSVPSGFSSEDQKRILRRRRVAIRTMEAMGVLDVAKEMHQKQKEKEKSKDKD